MMTTTTTTNDGMITLESHGTPPRPANRFRIDAHQIEDARGEVC